MWYNSGMSEKIDSPFGEAIIEIEKVLDLSSVTIFNVACDILHRTSPLFLNDETQIIVSPVVIVYNEDDEEIGSASLNIVGESVVANIYLDPATPERLTIETKSGDIYPHVQSLRNALNCVWIKGIILSSSAPSDPTIQPL